jgi:acyl-CoA synthetase (AMP-forming)/AMP-acid ligase II/acyl carrier protein
MGLGIASFTDAWARHAERGQTGPRRELFHSLRDQSEGDRCAFVFLHDGEVEQERVTFTQLHRRVAAAAEILSERAAAGERAILLYPSGIDFIVAFLGCLAAGLVAVPVSAPQPRTGLDTLRSVARDSGAALLLSAGAPLAKLAGKIAADPLLSRLQVSDTASWPQVPVVERLMRRASPYDLALLQYTSGSTGSPRGVAVRHGNLIENHRQVEHGFGTCADSVVASWLPMFHDMGLGCVLHSLWLGAPCILMSPAAFLHKPARWLQAISRYRVTMSGGPDFAYDLCSRRIGPPEKQELDLGCWQTAYDGSEPIRADVVSRFIREFAACNFRAEAFHPVYGLAEATLMVTAKPPLSPNQVVPFSREGLARGDVTGPDTAHEGDRIPDSDRTIALVGCGTPWLNAEVRIVDPHTLKPLPAGRIGEIWVAGPCVAAGYWGKEAETRATFRAHTRDGQGPFLRTGDLGMLHEGQLFITGRCKDLIIVRGKNHYPQDIEGSVSRCHGALEPARAAAVALPQNAATGTIDGNGARSPGEQLLIVQEVRRSALNSLDAEQVFAAIRSAVASEHGLAVHSVVLIHPATLLRTTSGKVRRKACLQAYLDGSLAEIARSVQSPSETAERPDPAPTMNGVLSALPPSIAPKSNDASPGVAVEAEEQAALRRRVEEHILSWVARQRQISPSQIDPNAPISNSGIDSLARVDLVRSLEKLFSVRVSESELHAIESIADLSRLMLDLCGPNRTAAEGKQRVTATSGVANELPKRAHVELPRFTPIKWD